MSRTTAQISRALSNRPKKLCWREARMNFWNFMEIVHLLALMVVFAAMLLIAGYTVRLFLT